MHKRLPLLATCLALAAFGISACGPSGDRGARSSATPAPASASASASAAPTGSPSATPAELRGLTGLAAKFYLKTIREHYPDLDHISDDVLVAHGNALCVARGQAFVDQALKTKRELGITGKQTSRIIGTAHGSCGRKMNW
ncbi:hypothetical protein [Streptomyces chrestomyceticus]|uniref:hypothetical protein n=1 Tax=Streptomyces chrestomyceticus TaxID=68185 RepID=UPI0019D2E1DF|nr:hypothetical protein [Streptomyces chrestomyceticus]